MKSLICALVIFTILAGLVITNAFYVNKTMKNISALVIELENEINEEKKNAVVALWNDNRKLLSLSIEADELERMNDLIESLRVIDYQNNFPEFQKYCRLVRELALELSDYESISVEGIL